MYMDIHHEFYRNDHKFVDRDQGLHYLPFCQPLLIPFGHILWTSQIVQILGWLQQFFWVSEFLGFWRYFLYVSGKLRQKQEQDADKHSKSTSKSLSAIEEFCEKFDQSVRKTYIKVSR